MFRPNTGIDLNDFPALGTPASSSRAAPAGSLPPQPPSSSLLPSNRFATYPSSASNPNHLQEALLGSGAAANTNVSDFGGVQTSSPLGSYQGVHSASAAAAYSGHSGDHHQLATARGLAPRTFSMDDFPALRSSAAPSFGNDMSTSALNSKPEPWDYSGREGIPSSLNGTCSKNE